MEELFQKAKAGDSQALDQLLTEVRPSLLNYLYRRTGDLEVAEDLCQEVLLKIYTQIPQVQGEVSFPTLVFALASQRCSEVLPHKQPWSVDTLEILQNHLLEKKGAEQEVQRIYDEYEEHYQIQDHVDFCFTVLGKTLLPLEQNIFLLKELAGLRDETIATLTGQSEESVQTQWRSATETLAQLYQQRCSLIRKEAPCQQCQDFGRWLEGDEVMQKQLQALPFEPGANAQTNFFNRLEMIQDAQLSKAPSKHFHQSLMELVRFLLGEKGSLTGEA